MCKNRDKQTNRYVKTEINNTDILIKISKLKKKTDK